MTNEFNFGFMNIVELGEIISTKLDEYGINDKAELTIPIDADNFKKADEDLFYRNRKDENEKFIPSEGEIDVNFEKIKIILKDKAWKS